MLQKPITRQELAQMIENINAQLDPIRQAIIHCYMLCSLPPARIILQTGEDGCADEIPQFVYGEQKFPPEVQERIDMLNEMARAIIDASGIKHVTLRD